MKYELSYEELPGAPKVRRKKRKPKQPPAVHHIPIRQYGLSTGVIVIVRRDKCSILKQNLTDYTND